MFLKKRQSKIRKTSLKLVENFFKKFHQLKPVIRDRT